MHTARIPPVDPALATITAVLAMHAGHICPSSELLIRPRLSGDAALPLDAAEPVRDRRAGRTPRREVGPEHEVVDEELRAPSEEVCQRGAPLVGLESILLVDPNPRQLLPPPRQLVAAPR